MFSNMCIENSRGWKIEHRGGHMFLEGRGHEKNRRPKITTRLNEMKLKVSKSN